MSIDSCGVWPVGTTPKLIFSAEKRRLVFATQLTARLQLELNSLSLGPCGTDDSVTRMLTVFGRFNWLFGMRRVFITASSSAVPRGGMMMVGRRASTHPHDTVASVTWHRPL